MTRSTDNRPLILTIGVKGMAGPDRLRDIVQLCGIDRIVDMRRPSGGLWASKGLSRMFGAVRF